MQDDIIKHRVKERYGKIALVGSSSEGCCAPDECCGERVVIIAMSRQCKLQKILVIMLTI